MTYYQSINSRTFNIGDTVQRICTLVSKGHIQKARYIFQNEFIPPAGYSKAVLPITSAEYEYIRSVEEYNKGVEICVFHTQHSKPIKEA